MINWMKIWRKTYRTMAQTIIGLIPTSMWFGDIDWKLLVSATILSGVVCFLSGIADGDNNVELEEEEIC